MMCEDDGVRFDRLKKEILDLFRHPPKIDFSTQPHGTKLAFPSISSLGHRGDRASWSTSNMGKFVNDVTKRFLFNDFFNPKTSDLLSWSGEKVVTIDGSLAIVEHDGVSKRSINWDSRRAREWFQFDVVDAMAQDDDRDISFHFLLGDPGTGKSTLMKYLLNVERHNCIERNIIFTRLESSKFLAYVGKSKAEYDIDEKISGSIPFYYHCLMNYINAVVLRDIVFNYAISIKENGELRRNYSCFGGDQNIYNIVENALAKSSYPDKIQPVFEMITSSIQKCTLKFHSFPDFFLLDYRTSQLLIAEFTKEVERHTRESLKICVLYDGFDLLGPEDIVIDSDKIIIIRAILCLYGLCNPDIGDAESRLTAKMPNIRLSNPYIHRAFIVLRRSTFDYFVAVMHRDTFKRSIVIHELGALSSDVVLLKAISHAVAKHRLSTPDAATAHEKAVTIFNVVKTLLSRLNDFSKENRESGPGLVLEILDLFDGNLRDCLEFVRRMLLLLREEGESAGKLEERPTLDRVLDFAVSDESLAIARRRAYRAIELILFYGSPLYENAIIAGLEDPGRDNRRQLSPRLKKNHRSTGLIDNIFNYHVLPTDDENDSHYLLLKIRILQICSMSKPLKRFQIQDEISKLGYRIKDKNLLDDALVILRYTGAISVDPFSGDIFNRTSRGSHLIDNFLFSPTYLEHVFHQTLFPTSLVEHIIDRPRYENHDNWTIRSIRNYLIFLAYIQYVEERSQGGKNQAPPEMKIYPRMQQTVIDAVEKILDADRRDSRTRSVKNTITEGVSATLNDTMEAWRGLGLVGG